MRFQGIQSNGWHTLPKASTPLRLLKRPLAIVSDTCSGRAALGRYGGASAEKENQTSGRGAEFMRERATVLRRPIA
jgi:hypothetical protein